MRGVRARRWGWAAAAGIIGGRVGGVRCGRCGGYHGVRGGWDVLGELLEQYQVLFRKGWREGGMKH